MSGCLLATGESISVWGLKMTSIPLKSYGPAELSNASNTSMLIKSLRWKKEQPYFFVARNDVPALIVIRRPAKSSQFRTCHPRHRNCSGCADATQSTVSTKTAFRVLSGTGDYMRYRIVRKLDGGQM